MPHEATNNTIKQLRLLRKIDQEILSSISDLDKTFTTILNGIIELVGSKYADVALRDRNQLKIVASSEPKNIGKQIPIKDSVSGLAIIKERPINIGNISAEARYKPLFYEKMNSELAVPLILDNRIVGVLNTESQNQYAFTQADSDLLVTLAGQAAIAIRTARSNDELKAFREIDEAILNSANNLDETLKTILKSASKLLSAKFGTLLLAENDYLIIRASIGPDEPRIKEQIPISDSVTGRAFTKQRFILVPDVLKDPNYKVTLKREQMRSELAVPLIVNKRSIGVLNIESPEVNAFSKNDVRLLRALARQAAIAIHNARSYEAIQILHEIDNAILAAGTDLQETLITILKGGLQLTGASYGSVMLLEGNHLSNAASTTGSQESALAHVAINDSVTGRAFLHQKAILLPDTSKDPLYKPVSLTEHMRSELAVPLIDQGRSIGVLNMESKRLDAFDEQHRQLLSTLAVPAAIAIRNARSMERLEILREIDRAILVSASEDIKKTLNEILKGGLRLSNAKYGDLLLLDGNDLVIEATTIDPPKDHIGKRYAVENSICGLAVTTQKTTIINNVNQDRRYKQIFKGAQMCSEIVVPLRENSHVFGVLNIESPHRNAFISEDQEFLELLADQAAIAIKNAKANRKLQALRDIDLAILNQEITLKQTLDIVLAKSLELIDAQYGNIHLLKGNFLEICATSVPQIELIGTKVQVQDSVTGKAVIEKRAVVVPNTEKEPLYKRVLTFKHMRSELAVPLMEDNNVLGVINIESPRLSAFTESDRDLLEALAGQAALAIKLAKSRDELHILGEIDKSILKSDITLQEKLETILDLSTAYFNVSFGNILEIEGKDLLVIASTQKSNGLRIGARVEMGVNFKRKVMQEGKSFIIDDISIAPRNDEIASIPPKPRGVFVPMMVNNHTIGVLNLGSLNLNTFSDHDLEFLKTLAGQAAIAIRNAEAQKELQQMRTIKAISEAASWLVHKIGSSAINISWPAERLLMSWDNIAPDNEADREDIEMILRNAKHIGNLKKDLLSPLSTEQGDESESDLLIEPLLKEILKLSSLPNQAINLNIEANLPPVRAARSDLFSVFEELINNATAAMATTNRKNRLDILAFLVSDRKSIEIKFCDNGCGIGANEIDDIWTIGYTTKTEQAGTGMGLYKCSQILLRINGYISATNNVDNGATFIVKLPIWKDEANKS